MLPLASQLVIDTMQLISRESDEAEKAAFIERNLRTEDNPNGMLIGPHEIFFN